MKIKRVLYSKLPKSRIGIGWMQEGNGKTNSEKHMRRAQEAADESFDEDEEDEDRATRKAKSAATRSVLGDEAVGIGLKSLGAAGAGYVTARYLKEADSLLRKSGKSILNVDPNALPNIPNKVIDFSKNNAGKIAAGVGIGSLIYLANKNKLGKKVKSARTGAEINTRDRFKKHSRKKSNEDED